MAETPEKKPGEKNTLTDDQILEYTQQTRKKITDELFKDNRVPADKEDRTLLLRALQDMDQTAINKKRLGTDEKRAESDKLVAEAADRISRIYGSENPFEGNQSGRIPEVSSEQLPAANPIEGETEVGLVDESYDEFMSKMEDDDTDGK